MSCSADGGTTWTTINDQPLTIPLREPANPALVLDTAKRKQLAYIMDLALDSDGHPVVLLVTSQHHATGPKGDPREWRTLRWTGSAWDERVVTTSTNNYDAGSLIINEHGWHIIGPTGTGPQAMMTGGEMIRWQSADQGATWTSSALTAASEKITPTRGDQCRCTQTLSPSGQMATQGNAQIRRYILPISMVRYSCCLVR